jgi:hypothetical protein
MQDEPEAGDRSCWGLTIKVNNKPGMSVDDIRVFLKGSGAVHFEGEKKEEVYAWVSGCLGEQNWAELGRTARGLVRRYMEKMTGLSRAQITRLITCPCTCAQEISRRMPWLGIFVRQKRSRNRGCEPGVS